ncbi:MAG TPA: hypothetical protein VEJ87_11180, partial [Acidimicrobiales bacterium]|nr:hypothetical protein [Acidimicrobiales bacterium]
MGARITIVGGGSTHWSSTLLVDFANHPSLADAEVTLEDIDAGALALMGKLGAHIAERRNIPLQVRETTDIDEGLDGAEYVISAFSVGGFESMRHDI